MERICTEYGVIILTDEPPLNLLNRPDMVSNVESSVGYEQIRLPRDSRFSVEATRANKL